MSVFDQFIEKLFGKRESFIDGSNRIRAEMEKKGWKLVKHSTHILAMSKYEDGIEYYIAMQDMKSN